jgi:hypothetical protein
MSQEYFKSEIFHKLVIKDYSVNFLNHYKFMISGEKQVIGIVGLLDIMGDDVFQRAEVAREKMNSTVLNFPNIIKA